MKLKCKWASYNQFTQEIPSLAKRGRGDLAEVKNGERKVDFLGIPIPFILFFLIFIFVIYKLGKKNSEFIKYTKENTY